MELEKFEQLGRKLDALLLRVEELRKREDDLNRLLADKDNEIGKLKEVLVGFERDRDFVRTKVDELLGRIDEQLTT